LPQDEQGGATPFAPRTNKDLIEEALFAQRRDLFSQLDLVFFDTTSIYFYGQGGETSGQRGHSKDHRPELKQMVVGMLLDQNGNPVCSELCRFSAVSSTDRPAKKRSSTICACRASIWARRSRAASSAR
jgi:hypothetical protein